MDWEAIAAVIGGLTLVVAVIEGGRTIRALRSIGSWTRSLAMRLSSSLSKRLPRLRSPIAMPTAERRPELEKASGDAAREPEDDPGVQRTPRPRASTIKRELEDLYAEGERIRARLPASGTAITVGIGPTPEEWADQVCFVLRDADFGLEAYNFSRPTSTDTSVVGLLSLNPRRDVTARLVRLRKIIDYME
jgi:hypothetical protein